MRKGLVYIQFEVKDFEKGIPEYLLNIFITLQNRKIEGF